MKEKYSAQDLQELARYFDESDGIEVDLADPKEMQFILLSIGIKTKYKNSLPANGNFPGRWMFKKL